MRSATEQILERCKEEAATIMESPSSASLQEEELLSPVIKYLVAFSNQPEMCTETQITKNLSIPRPVTKRVIEALEAYQVIQPLADFGTVKPYRVSRMATAVKAAWVSFEPEEVRLLFGVRDGKKFKTQSGTFEHYVSTPKGSRWLPPMEASSSFFSAMTDSLDLASGIKRDLHLEQVDAKFLEKLLQEFHPIERDDLLFLEEKNEITEKDIIEARKRRSQKYCWIYYTIAEKMLAQEPRPRKEYLAFMSEILDSCTKVATAFQADQGLVDKGRRLREEIETALSTE